MDLSQLRQQIDTIDRQIVNLYEERMDVSRQVAEYKIETGENIFTTTRPELPGMPVSVPCAPFVPLTAVN